MGMKLAQESLVHFLQTTFGTQKKEHAVTVSRKSISALIGVN